jgi:hypothetical protein
MSRTDWVQYDLVVKVVVVVVADFNDKGTCAQQTDREKLGIDRRSNAQKTHYVFGGFELKSTRDRQADKKSFDQLNRKVER